MAGRHSLEESTGGVVVVENKSGIVCIYISYKAKSSSSTKPYRSKHWPKS
jgi:hypothetical protein